MRRLARRRRRRSRAGEVMRVHDDDAAGFWKRRFMEHLVNYKAIFGADPAGPCTLLRLVLASTAGEGSRYVAEVASVDVMVDDDGSRAGPIRHVEFGRWSDPPGVEGSACTPRDLASVIWSPYAPDVLVTHDLTATQAILPAAITADLPWIGTLRVYRHLWPDVHACDLAAILASRAGGGLACGADGIAPEQGVLRPLLLLRDLTRALLRDPRVRGSRRGSASLKPLLGALLAPDGVQGMVDLSIAPAEPQGFPPGPWEGPEGWHGLPKDDLEFFSMADGWIGEAARAEVHRRLDVSRSSQPTSRVVLRRFAGLVDGQGGQDAAA